MNCDDDARKKWWPVWDRILISTVPRVFSDGRETEACTHVIQVFLHVCICYWLSSMFNRLSDGFLPVPSIIHSICALFATELPLKLHKRKRD